MPLDSNLVGVSVRIGPMNVSPRWMMAYAASVGAKGKSYFDTASEAGIVSHPLFPVALEWPAMLALGETPESAALTPLERARNVHGAIDLHLFRPLRADDLVTVDATIIGLEQRGRNTFQFLRVDSRDARGELVCRAYQTGVFLGTTLQGERAASENIPEIPSMEALTSDEVEEICIPIPDGQAHVYSECSQIWNPIHTDAGVALEAGLPGIILHGSATLALTVSALVERYLGNDPGKVIRLGCEFRANVFQPSTILVAVGQSQEPGLWFQVANEVGDAVLKNGFMITR